MRAVWVIPLMVIGCRTPPFTPGELATPDAGIVAPLDLSTARDSAAPLDLSREIDSAAPLDLALVRDLALAVVAVPRLLAPLSTSTVTQRRPTLRWELSSGSGSPVVDLCKDRQCTMSLSIGAPVASSRTSAMPTAALPSGWVFWRVRVVAGNQVATSATWQMWVGKASASTQADTSSGTVLDVNGDGHPDLLVGANGGAYLYIGNGTGTPSQRIDLTSPDGTNVGFGTAVGSAGDINGDGYADFVIGAQFAGSFAGAAHVYLGRATPSATDWNGSSATRRIDLTNPDGANAKFGYPMVSAGDVNGDGYADFLVGAVGSGSWNGAAHFYFGAATPNANDWNGASPARRIDLADPDGDGALFGTSVSSAGDVNADGLADFLIGASSAGSNAGGAAHLYLGERTASAADWNGASPAKRIDLVNPHGANAAFGYSVSCAGDINGDGYSDLLVGAVNVGPTVGVTHLYLGGAAASATDWNGASPAKRIDLTGTGGNFGFSVASAGDVNGDGYGDFLISAPGSDYSYGMAHLYLGEATASASDWTGLSPGRRIDLFNPDAEPAQYGASVAGAGDVDGDGFADFFVGAPLSGKSSGVANLYLGEAAPSANDWDGASSAKRIDMSNPDGAHIEFGVSLAGAN